MIVRRFLIALVAVAAAAVAALAWWGRSEEPPPWRAERVVLFTVDTLRADRLGLYGYRDVPTSPHLDAWSKDAIVFERASALAPWTVPSLASMFTGRFAGEMGVYTNETGIPSDWPTIAEIFQEAGYATAAFNSHSVLLEEEMGFRRGFDAVYPESAKVVLDGEHKIAFSTAEPHLLRWIDEHAADRFFLWIHNMDPHHPETPGNPYLESEDWHRYDAEVRWVDEAFGRIVAHLQASGAWEDDLLFVFTADHGEALGDHGLMGHQNVMYDEVLRVPLLIYYSAMEGPKRVREPVDLLDVRSTILDLAGLAEAPGVYGESLVPLLTGERGRRRRDVSVHSRYYFEDGHHEYAIRDRLWKLIVKTPASEDRLGVGWPLWQIDGEGVRYELYNLSVDPDELNDVAEQYPAVVDRLRGNLEEWRSALDEPQDEAPRLDEEDIETLRNLGYNPDSDLDQD
jgi:arylsulfatase A-like enzyme